MYFRAPMKTAMLLLCLGLVGCADEAWTDAWLTEYAHPALALTAIDSGASTVSTTNQPIAGRQVRYTTTAPFSFASAGSKDAGRFDPSLPLGARLDGSFTLVVDDMTPVFPISVALDLLGYDSGCGASCTSFLGEVGGTAVSGTVTRVGESAVGGGLRRERARRSLDRFYTGGDAQALVRAGARTTSCERRSITMPRIRSTSRMIWVCCAPRTMNAGREPPGSL